MKAGIMTISSILQRDKRQIKAQLKDLGIIDHFQGDCAVETMTGKPNI